jgi:hypothetical protein
LLRAKQTELGTSSVEYMWTMNGTSNGLCECNGTWECDGNIMVTNTWISYWDGVCWGEVDGFYDVLDRKKQGD